MVQNKILTYINANTVLKEVFKEYLNTCNSISLPYHNIQHTFNMMEHIINMYENQNKYSDITIKEDDLLILLIVAILHDINHSGGICTDHVNVHTALNMSENMIRYIFHKHNYEGDFQDNLCDFLISHVSQAILATEYPYIIDYNELQQNEKIIRELDFISQLSNVFFTHTLCGLKTELRSKSWVDAVTNYTTFTENMIKEIKLQYSKEYIQNNLEKILNILTNLSVALS